MFTGRIAGVLLFFALAHSAYGQQNGTNICSDPNKTEHFALGNDAKINVTGETHEGSLCVQVDYDPLHFYVDFSSAVSYTNGPDLTTVLLGGLSNTSDTTKPNISKNRPSVLGPPTPPQSLPEAFFEIEASYNALHISLHTLDRKYSQALDDVKQAVAEVNNLVSQVDATPSSQRGAAVKNLYKTTVQASLDNAIKIQTNYLPSDRTANPGDLSLLDALNYAKDSIDFLSQQFPSGDPTATNADFECSSNRASAKIPSWALWYSKCKSAYDGLETEVTADIAMAQQYTAQSDKVTALRKSLAVAKFWDERLSSMGLTRQLTPAQIDSLNLSPAMTKSAPETCSNLFNKSETRIVSVSYSDLTPTLNGSAPTPGKTDPFVTITCTTPFSLSAGVAFSTIPNPEFAIVKSSGPNNTSVNEFRTLSDSRPHPMPIAIANVRLHDWKNNLLAAHLSFGVAGNFQAQSSGGSSADFLLGGSLSIWRTMFLTLGLDVGAQPSLGGGFHVGGTVPPDVTSVPVSKSYTTGFGFAITFTKP
jgi:hypothetical protein